MSCGFRGPSSDAVDATLDNTHHFTQVCVQKCTNIAKKTLTFRRNANEMCFLRKVDCAHPMNTRLQARNLVRWVGSTSLIHHRLSFQRCYWDAPKHKQTNNTQNQNKTIEAYPVWKLLLEFLQEHTRTHVHTNMHTLIYTHTNTHTHKCTRVESCI